jgi:hypothetical protein
MQAQQQIGAQRKSQHGGTTNYNPETITYNKIIIFKHPKIGYND